MRGSPRWRNALGTLTQWVTMPSLLLSRLLLAPAQTYEPIVDSCFVNVFASWCTACRYEHPVFMRLQEDGVVPIHGINYKDRPRDAAKWLDELGDPYTRTGADLDGRVGIEWGVYGVPETYVIDRDGRIVFKQVGPVTPDIYHEKIGPLIKELRK